MAARVARKDMKQGKRFRLSTEVRATLQRKHDRWTPYHAYSRVEKDLGVFRALCKLILSFFQTAVTENNDEVGCNGKAVKMFAEMIRCSLRDLSIFIRIRGRKNSIRDSKFFSYRKTGTGRFFENLKRDNNFFNSKIM